MPLTVSHIIICRNISSTSDTGLSLLHQGCIYKFWAPWQMSPWAPVRNFTYYHTYSRAPAKCWAHWICQGIDAPPTTLFSAVYFTTLFHQEYITTGLCVTSNIRKVSNINFRSYTQMSHSHANTDLRNICLSQCSHRYSQKRGCRLKAPASLPLWIWAQSPAESSPLSSPAFPQRSSWPQWEQQQDT